AKNCVPWTFGTVSVTVTPCPGCRLPLQLVLTRLGKDKSTAQLIVLSDDVTVAEPIDPFVLAPRLSSVSFCGSGVVGVSPMFTTWNFTVTGSPLGTGSGDVSS